MPEGRDRMPDFEMLQFPETPYVYVEGRSSMAPADISREMGSAFRTAWEAMQAAGIPPGGPALSVYHDYDPEEMRFRAGFVVNVADAPKAEAPLRADMLPAGEVLHFTHRGPYATLRDDYEKMMKHLSETGQAPGAPSWELYLNDPSDTPAEDLVTEVYVPLA